MSAILSLYISESFPPSELADQNSKLDGDVVANAFKKSFEESQESNAKLAGTSTTGTEEKKEEKEEKKEVSDPAAFYVLCGPFFHSASFLLCACLFSTADRGSAKTPSLFFPFCTVKADAQLDLYAASAIHHTNLPSHLPSFIFSSFPILR